MAVCKERFEATIKNSMEEKGKAKKGMRFLKARSPSVFRQVASGSATQGLWLGNGKEGSQAVGEDRCQLPTPLEKNRWGS